MNLNREFSVTQINILYVVSWCYLIHYLLYAILTNISYRKAMEIYITTVPFINRSLLYETATK